MEILHPAVCHAQFHHRLELFCNYSFFGIREQHRCGPIQHCRERAFDGVRRNGVTETDVNLHRYAGFLEEPQETDPHALIIGIFLDALRGDTLRVEDHAVVGYRGCADFLKSRLKASRIIFTLGKGIRISRGTVCLFGPEFKEQYAL